MEDDFFENDLIEQFEKMLEDKEEHYFDTEQFYEIIAYYLDINDLTYAEKALTYGLRLHPDSVEIRVKKLELVLEKKQLTLAADMIAELKEICDSDTDFLICCGKFWSLKNLPKQAIKFYLRALDLGEDLEFIHNCLGNEYAAYSDLEHALYHYKKALEFNLDDEYAMFACIDCFEKMHRTHDSIAFLLQYIDLRPYSELAWMQLGHDYLAVKDYAEAYRAFEYVTLIDDKSITAYSQMAYCLEKQKNYTGALGCYEEIFALDPSAAHTHVKAGECYLKLNQPFKALNQFHIAIHLDPQMEKAWRLSSDLYEQLGNYDEALHYIRNAHELNPTDTDNLKKYAYLFVQLGQYEEALDQFSKLLRLEKNNFYNWLGASELLITIGDYNRAILLLTDGTARFERAELYYQLSNCHFLLKQEELGEKALLRAQELNPKLVSEMVAKYPILEQKIQPGGNRLAQS